MSAHTFDLVVQPLQQAFLPLKGGLESRRGHKLADAILLVEQKRSSTVVDVAGSEGHRP